MASNFGKEITPGSAGWFNLLTLMQAAGYTGGARASQLSINNNDGLVFRLKTGHSSGTVAPVSATDGIDVSGKGENMFDAELGIAWVYVDGAPNVFDCRATSPIG